MSMDMVRLTASKSEPIRLVLTEQQKRKPVNNHLNMHSIALHYILIRVVIHVKALDVH